MTWKDIKGWFDFEDVYAEQVRRAKPGARFVEIGAWLGKSAAFMAQEIAASKKSIEFYVVDSWNNTNVSDFNGSPKDGAYATCNNGKTKEIFYANMEACGAQLTEVIESDSTIAAERFADESLDFVFIDGDHSPEKVYADCAAWWPKIKRGGLLAGHDFDETGPQSAVVKFARERSVALYGDGKYGREGYRCFGVVKPTVDSYGIMLAVPHYDGSALAPSLVTACTRQFAGCGFVAVKENGHSSLTANFNHLWCSALNTPNVTHFAMLHADIIPQHYWLDVLLRELEQENAQMCSAIMPIKDHFGVTSTGIAHPTDHFTAKRRFTMRELMEMPSTFDSERIGYGDHDLVVNTGCWIADLRDDRWRTENEDGTLFAHFTMNDCIRKVNGQYAPYFEPEDWYFSRRAQELGLRVVATRKPQATHIGNYGFRNQGPWGSWSEDERTKQYWIPDLTDDRVYIPGEACETSAQIA